MRRFGAAVIGTHGVGSAHVAALSELSSVEVRAVLGASPQSSRTASGRYGTNVRVDGLDELLDVDDIDVIHICTPNHTHADIAVAALNRGRHVICEKPLAHSLADGRRMLAASRGVDQRAVLSYPYRYLPLVGRLRRLVAQGALGAIHGARVEYLQNWMLSALGGWRSDLAQVGRSRVLADIGVHVFDLLEIVTGSTPTAIAAEFSSLREGPTAADDQVGLTMRLANGVIATAAISQVSAAHLNRLSIAVDGSDGSAHWEFDTYERLTFVPLGGASALRLDGHAPSSANGEFWTSSGEPGQPLRSLLSAAYDAIAGLRVEDDGMPHLPQFADGLRHLELVDHACGALSNSDVRPVAVSVAGKETTTGGGWA